MSSGSSIFGQKNPFIGIKEFQWMINICTDRFRRKKIKVMWVELKWYITEVLQMMITILLKKKSMNFQSWNWML